MIPLQLFPIIMKLIGLFGALLAISPVFAATPGSCAGKVPTTTVAECDKSKPCSFFYSKSNPRGFEIGKSSKGPFQLLEHLYKL